MENMSEAPPGRSWRSLFGVLTAVVDGKVIPEGAGLVKSTAGRLAAASGWFWACVNTASYGSRRSARRRSRGRTALGPGRCARDDVGAGSAGVVVRSSWWACGGVFGVVSRVRAVPGWAGRGRGCRSSLRPGGWGMERFGVRPGGVNQRGDLAALRRGSDVARPRARTWQGAWSCCGLVST